MAAKWEWRTDDNKFVPYKDDDNAAIEKAYAMGTLSFPHSMAKQSYEMNLEKLVQRNTKTNRERQIRRVGPGTALLAFGHVWEWQSSKGHFTAYDRKTNDIIEREYLSDALMCKVVVATGAHDTGELLIHFGHMHQENKSNTKAHGTRKIRRVYRKITPEETAAPVASTISDDEGDVEMVGTSPARGRKPAAEVATGTKRRPPSPSPVGEPRGDHIKKPIDITTFHDIPYVAEPGLESASKGSMSMSSWILKDSCLILRYATSRDAEQKAIKLAAFDMDDTLIMPNGKHTFAKGRNDWKWLDSCVPSKLKELRDQGYQIVIFSNQSGIDGSKGYNESLCSQIKGKILDLSESAKVPISAFVSTSDDEYRKPSPKMFHTYLEYLGGKQGGVVDMDKSFYCGDAAGRMMMSMAGRKKDFSCSDRKFAYNAKLKFCTPEELFLKKAPVSFDWDGLGPDDLQALKTVAPPVPSDYVTSSTEQELVIFVGFPGCGKSTFFKRVFKPKGYVHVNRDTLGDWKKCVAAADAALASGSSVVIDNTSPNSDDRSRYTSLAKKHSTKLRCFHFLASQKLAGHMNAVRARMGIAPKVPAIGYNMFKSKFEEPDAASEGFTSPVVKIHPHAHFAGLPADLQEQFFMLS